MTLKLVLLMHLTARFPANDINAKFDSVSDSKVDESHIDHDKVQSIEKSIVNEVSAEPSESSKPIESPPKVRRSTRLCVPILDHIQKYCFFGIFHCNFLNS